MARNIVVYGNLLATGFDLFNSLKFAAFQPQQLQNQRLWKCKKPEIKSNVMEKIGYTLFYNNFPISFYYFYCAILHEYMKHAFWFESFFGKKIID